MKTTLELPDELLAKAKATAVRRRISLKALFMQALEHELRPEPPQTSVARFKIDDQGWPVLERQVGTRVVVTDDFVCELRAAEGI